MKGEISLEEAKKVIEEYPTCEAYAKEYRKMKEVYHQHLNRADASIYWHKCNNLVNQSK